MGHTVYYKGKLKEPDNITAFIETATSKAKECGWAVMELTDDIPGIGFELPDSEPLMFMVKNGKIDDFTKYIGTDNKVVTNICDILWTLKPFFKRLEVNDDYGVWDEYVLTLTSKKYPPFRELTAIEKAELERNFDLPDDYELPFLTPRRASSAKNVLMKMICKDIGTGSKAEMLDSMDERLRGFYSDLTKSIDEQIIDYQQYENSDVHVRLFKSYQMEYDFNYMVQNWMLKKLTNKKGAQIIYNPYKRSDLTVVFALLMVECVIGSYSPGLGAKYTLLVKFRHYLMKQGYNFDEEESVLRYIYSVMDSLGCIRPDNLKEIPQRN